VKAPAPGGATDPTLHGASLVVYDSAGSGERTPVMVLPVAGWRRQGTTARPTYRFRSTDPAIGIVRATLKSGKLAIRGGGAAFAYTLDEASQGSIALRFTLGDGALTYCAEGGRSPFPPRIDQRDRFSAQPKTPAPSSCPPVP